MYAQGNQASLLEPQHPRCHSRLLPPSPAVSTSKSTTPTHHPAAGAPGPPAQRAGSWHRDAPPAAAAAQCGPRHRQTAREGPLQPVRAAPAGWIGGSVGGLEQTKPAQLTDPQGRAFLPTAIGHPLPQQHRTTAVHVPCSTPCSTCVPVPAQRLLCLLCPPPVPEAALPSPPLSLLQRPAPRWRAPSGRPCCPAALQRGGDGAAVPARQGPHPAAGQPRGRGEEGKCRVAGGAMTKLQVLSASRIPLTCIRGACSTA